MTTSDQPNSPQPEPQCVALLWYARHRDLTADDVRCSRVALHRVAGTEAVVCALHADALRFGRTIATIDGPLEGRELVPLYPHVKPLRTVRIVEHVRRAQSNPTRAAFPDGLPPRPIGFDARRWRILELRMDGAPLAEIAEELGLTRQRAHQLEQSALRRLGVDMATQERDAA
jgi:sigma-70-like protein